MHFTELVSTGRDTLAGRYMRAYWQPVHVLDELRPGRAKPLRIMGEDFTIFRTESGKVHLVASRCAHRGTILSAGWVEGETIRCRYHGWRYDGDGQCVEQPGERDREFCSDVKLQHRPVHVVGGLVFAYLGDGLPPAFPTFPDLEDGGVVEAYYYKRDCNFYNAMDNTLDQVHVSFTHRDVFAPISEIPHMRIEERDWGVILYATRSSGLTRVTEFLVPNMLRTNIPFGEGEHTWTDYLVWRVPIDDESHYAFATNHVHIQGEERKRYLEKRERIRALPVPPVNDLAEAVLAGEMTLEEAKVKMGEHDPYYDVIIEDHVALGGQGVVADRFHERLGVADEPVVAVRRRWLKDLEHISLGEPLYAWTSLERTRAEAGAPAIS